MAGLWQPNVYVDPVISGPVILDTVNRNGPCQQLQPFPYCIIRGTVSSNRSYCRPAQVPNMLRDQTYKLSEVDKD